MWHGKKDVELKHGNEGWIKTKERKKIGPVVEDKNLCHYYKPGNLKELAVKKKIQ